VVNLVIVVPAQSRTFYVSPQGLDRNPGSETQPFQTVERAQRAVRELNRQMSGDITILLRGGTYWLDRALQFNSLDSGMNGYKVVYKKMPGERPVLSGGRKIVGWQRDEGNRWKAVVDVPNFRQLYINGVRGIRARGGELPGATFEGLDGYFTSNGAMAKWKNPSDLELVYDIQWQRVYCKVVSVEPKGSGSVVSMLQPFFLMARLKEGKQIQLPSFVENAFELLDEPGEWYLDRPTKVLYYVPRPGEDMNQAEVIVPAVEKLMDVRGTVDQPVHDIQFQGLSFADASWLQPSEIGHIDLQANFTVSQHNLTLRTGDKRYGPGPALLANPYGEAVKSPSAVVLHAAKAIRFERCEFTRLGSGGIDIEHGSQGNQISGCLFHDISGSAIQIGDVIDHHPKDLRAILENNRVVNNFIHHVAVDYKAGVGVFVGYTAATLIAHNEIAHLPYSGISVGWGWGETDAGGGAYWQSSFYDTPTPSRNNRIESNHIHHVMLETWDGAAIYTLGNMPGSIIRGNHIHDNVGWPGGIYLDEGSGYIEVTGNLVYALSGRVADGSPHHPQPMNYNNRRQSRIDTCKEHDNFFDVEPGSARFPKAIVDQAGLEPAYLDLLDDGKSPKGAR
jgi:parallel beta helix pectate lyase-like protein/glycosyl hydrolase family 141